MTELDLKGKKVVVALSGGVDSSVTAALALRAGAEVTGLTLRMRPAGTAGGSWKCFTEADEAAVAAVVAELGIPHVYRDVAEPFRERVLRPSALEYARGRTPNPCCVCNPLVKFYELLRFADETGASAVATGHYARVVRLNGVARLRKGLDPDKDQSYFLYRLGAAALERLWLPLGEMTKPEVRRLAAEFGLPTASRPDSQDSCFLVPGESFGETLRRMFDLPERPGRFLFRGKTVGRHSGVHRFTIGQRKGLNVALGRPAYVVGIDPVSSDVRLDTDETLLEKPSFDVVSPVWHDPAGYPDACAVKIRYRSPAVPARLEASADGLCVIPDHPPRAVTPGQSAVFYDGDLLLGGGEIR